MSATSRWFAAALTSALCCTVLAGPASAGAIEKREAKRIKKALIAIERELDRTAADLEGLERRSSELDDLISSTERALARRPRRTEGAFSSALVFVSDLVRLSSARSEQETVEAGVTKLMQETQTLTTQRDEKIAELQVLVRKAREDDDITGQTAPAGNPGPSLSVGGSLITYSADWEATAQCESSGDWHINAYHDGGLQFLPSTWIGFGGGVFARYAYQASKRQQIAIAERVLAIQGPGAWPNCFRPLPVDF